MSYLDSLNRFISNPTNLDIKRSTFKRDSSHKTTFKAGKLIPIYCDEILPGDSVSMDVASLIRSITPAVPVMDNAFLDIYFFWVPSRICTAHPGDWQKIFGENQSGFWAQAQEYTLENTGNTERLEEYDSYCIGSYLGLPQYVYPDDADTFSKQINKLPLNAYVLIWNEWFRDQNVQAPKSFGSVFYSSGVFDVNKIHDYFTSALPAPQKGQSVLLPIGEFAPVITRTVSIPHGAIIQPPAPGVRFMSDQGAPRTGETEEILGLTGQAISPKYLIGSDVLSLKNGTTGEFITGGKVDITGSKIVPENLWADLTQATAVSVNQMREAFAIQRLLEKDARGGSRYREMLKAHFGVSIPDNTVQVPEYLGGKRIPLNMQQVLQNSETNTSPLGTTGAFSNTFAKNKLFVKSFTEYGYIMGVACVRCEQSYSQGLPKIFTRNRRFDMYHPVFANLGEQAVMKSELYVPDNYGVSHFSAVFGYQEAWAEYRYKNNIVSGELAPNSGNTILDSWTYTNNFSSQPTLNSDFMEQPGSQFDKTFVIDNSDYHFIGDFYFDCLMTRPMPLYSIPGLIDHH